MSPDLLLINPGGRRAIYQGLGDALTAIEPPLWCRLIAGYCRDRGHSVDILDAEAEDLAPEQVAGRVREARPGLVTIVAYGHQPSASTQQMAPAGEIARAIKLADLAQPVAICGGHVAALPERTMREVAVDYACTGEGPATIEGLLRRDRLSGVPGLAWRDGGRVRINPPADKIADLDKDLHGKAWDLLPMDRYRAHNWQCFDGSPRQPYAAIYTSLGCPYACSFCCINAPFGGRGYRTRSPAEVVTEVQALYWRHGVSTLKVVDEMFVLKPSHYLAVCERLAEQRFADALNIWAYARIDTVKPDTLALLRKAGVRWLALGIESGSAHVRDGARKSLQESDIHYTVQAIRRAGINVIGNFIFGLPDDTMDSMRATLDLAKALDLDFANFYSAMAYPGSRLFEEARAEDLPRAWSGYSQHSRDTTPLPTAALSAAEVLAFRDNAFRAYFEDEAYLERIDRKFGAHAVAQVRAMSAHRLPRNLLAA